METFYLIDYENVNSDGLAGCDKLIGTDHIIIFFTKNAKKIDMSEIANHGDATLGMIEVPPGKQSVDIHIGSYLGYISGKNEGKDCNVVIISKDTDFDNVIHFWNDKAKIKVSRAQQIKAAFSEVSSTESSAVKTSSAKASTVDRSQAKKTSAKVDGNKKTMLNQEVMQAVRTAGFDAKVSNSVAKLVTGFYGKDGFANEIHNMLREKYPNYLDIYEAIKPVLSNYDELTKAKIANTKIANTPTPAGRDKTVTNTEMIQILNKSGYDNDVANYVASTVVKHMGVKNGKQQIYRTIISKYGQNKGLAVYNQIKKHI